MSTTTNTPCDCGRETFWTVGGVARCWCCTPAGVAVVATTAVRSTVSGRVFGRGTTVPAALVADVAPVC